MKKSPKRLEFLKKYNYNFHVSQSASSLSIFSPQRDECDLSLYFFGWIGSVFADSTLTIFFADSYRNISGHFIQLPWSASFYRFTKKEHQFYAVVARDIIFNASRVIILPLLIVVFAINFYPFIISFLCASLFTLLYPFVGRAEEGT